MKKFLTSFFKRERKLNTRTEEKQSYATALADGIFASLMIHNEF